MIVNELLLLAGVPLYVDKLRLEFYQPTLLELCNFGMDKYSEAISTLTLTKKAIEDNLSEEVRKEIEQLQDFHICCLFISMKTKEGNSCVKDFLNLIFPNYNVSFNFDSDTPSIIFISNEISSMTMIEPSNYEIFTGVLKEIFALDDNSRKEYNIKEGDTQAEAIRKKIEEGKARRARQKPQDKRSVLYNMISSLSIGLKISLKEVYEMTLYQFYAQLARFQKHESYEITIKSAMAGAKIEEFPNWYEDI